MSVVSGELGAVTSVLSAGLPLLPERLELRLVHHQQADQHKEPAQDDGSRHTFSRVVLGVESLLFGSQSIKSSGGVGFLAGCQKGRRKFSGRQKVT